MDQADFRAAPCTQMGRNKQQRNRGHPVDSRCLSKAVRPYPFKLFLQLVRKAGQPGKAELVRNLHLLVLPDALNVPSLPFQIDRILRINTNPLSGFPVDRAKLRPDPFKTIEVHTLHGEEFERAAPDTIPIKA